MATATATTKTSSVSTKADSAPAPIDARRTPLASPTAELKSNPLDAAAPPKSPASSSTPAAKPAADASKTSSATTAAPAAPAGEPDPEEVEQSSGDVINMEVFQQILDLEEDEDSFEFSLGMAQAYISQAKDAFTKMDKALLAKDLKNLSDLGHFLKGSSAALGVQKVQESCERMQNYGKRMDAKGTTPVSDAVALQRITTLLARVKREFAEAETYLKDWYTERGLDL